MKFGDKQTSSDAESAAQSSDSSLWVDNYKPTNIRQIIGQQGDKSSARKLYIWLSNWRDNFWKKPVCTVQLVVCSLSSYEVHSINKLLNSIILLIFKM